MYGTKNNALNTRVKMTSIKLAFWGTAVFGLFSCSNNPPREELPEPSVAYNKAFEGILDSAKLSGSILIYQPSKETFYSNDFKDCEKGGLPASTFKITNSIIALETGVVEDDSTLFKWDGKPRRLKIWEQPLIFRQAFHYSCVPCYQDVARRIGVKRMQEHLKKFNYGNMLVDSSTIDLFWLEGESKITPYQQIDFLKRFYMNELPIKDRTSKIMKRLMVIDENDSFTISGKTGWAIRNGNNQGWFVGYLEKNNETYFFATHVEPEESFNMKMFPAIRGQVIRRAFKELGVIEEQVGLPQ